MVSNDNGIPKTPVKSKKLPISVVERPIDKAQTSFTSPAPTTPTTDKMKPIKNTINSGIKKTSSRRKKTNNNERKKMINVVRLDILRQRISV